MSLCFYGHINLGDRIRVVEIYSVFPKYASAGYPLPTKFLQHLTKKTFHLQDDFNPSPCMYISSLRGSCRFRAGFPSGIAKGQGPFYKNHIC
jgi:hypothetical protein